MPHLDRGQAGASARREYERRRDARHHRLRSRYGAAGALLARVTEEPQTTDAWRVGADGEVQAAAKLEKRLEGTGVVLLHDRRVPGSRANVDHLAIGPGGVTVIDAKAIKGRVCVERRGGLFSKRTEHLVVAGRDRTKLVARVEWQIETVRRVVGDDVDVRGALCWMDVDGLPLLGRLEMRGIVVDGTKRVARIAARPGTMDAAQVDALVRTLASGLPAR